MSSSRSLCHEPVCDSSNRRRCVCQDSLNPSCEVPTRQYRFQSSPHHRSNRHQRLSSSPLKSCDSSAKTHSTVFIRSPCRGNMSPNRACCAESFHRTIQQNYSVRYNGHSSWWAFLLVTLIFFTQQTFGQQSGGT